MSIAKGEEVHRKPLARLPSVLYDKRLIFEMPALLLFDEGKMTLTCLIKQICILIIKSPTNTAAVCIENNPVILSVMLLLADNPLKKR